jgi:hypothetical protein
MAVTNQVVDRQFSNLKHQYGGHRDDYLGLLYLEHEFDLGEERAAQQLAFSETDYGIDGFHFDSERRNLYLFEFKCSDSCTPFKKSLSQIASVGMDLIFGPDSHDHQSNGPAHGQDQLLLQIRSCLAENEAMIERICIHLVFMGDPAEAEQSQVLDTLREDVENKKYRIDQHFGRPVTMVIEFRSAPTRRVGSISRMRKTYSYPVQFDDTVTRCGTSGEAMTVGFIRLTDLYTIYQDMGARFFERNIRSAIPKGEAVDHSIQASIKRIVHDGDESAETFAFNHNGVTLFAEVLQSTGNGHVKLTEPRILNGAQTVMSVTRFLKSTNRDPLSEERKDRLRRIQVLCRVITGARAEFVTTVTINNNRQNPVDPWHLHANDMIQLEIQDKLRNDLGIYYERQENAFCNFTPDELERQGIYQSRAIELTHLARTLLAGDGNIDKLTRFRDVFEDSEVYNQVFNRNCLGADSRILVLCYKVRFRLRRLMNDIVEKGVNKYSFVQRARYLLWALLCQAILNDPSLEEFANDFGRTLNMEDAYTEILSDLATTRCRFLLSDLATSKVYANKAAEGNFSFMRTNAAYKRSMERANKRWHWVERSLRA